MERLYFQEMKERFEELSQNGVFRDKKIYLFGHCNARSEERRVGKEWSAVYI